MNILKNKFILTFLFIIFLLLFFSIGVNASTTYYHNDNAIVLPDIPFDTTEHPYYIITRHSSNKTYQLGYPESDFDKIYTVSKYGTCITYNVKDTSELGQWVFYEYSDGSWGEPKTTSAHYLQWVSYVLYSTVDIYTGYESTELFFQVSPLMTVTGTTLTGITSVEEIPKIMVTVVKILIQVGLVVLGIGLVICLIKRVVY